MEKVRLALDWTPNINHIGFFIAREKGFYRDRGLEVEIIDPAADRYTLTPAKKVEQGLADIALCPTESLISYRTKAKPFPLKGIAALFREDLSAITVLATSDIKSPRDLDDTTYASYQARYEDEIVRQMIRHDGGHGRLEVHYPEKLGIWDTLLNGAYDATWIFLNWEGVEAEVRGVSLTHFKMKDYQIPYSYSPLMAVDESAIISRRATFRSFLDATREAYLYCRKNPEPAVETLRPFIPPQDQSIDLERALEVSAPHFGTADNWGRMEANVMKDFLDWIYRKGLESQKLEAAELYTNALLA